MTDMQYMQRCLQLAQLSKGHTSPNPMVGAVLVHEGRIIGEGYHHYYGAAHAEVNCLDNVQESYKHLIAESTMFVNLEPCAHYGLTPPCANRLVAEQVKKVVIGNTDPFELVGGKGITILKEAGIEVSTGVLAKEGSWVNRRFFCFHTHKRPYIILKWAQTKEGFIAPKDKSRFQITGEESMQVSHKWRTEEGAIMVGYNTALGDNPVLTARLHVGRQPLRIVLDRNLSLPQSHNIFNIDAATWIINDREETVTGNIHYIQIPFGDDMLQSVMARLHSARILSVIVEGGTLLLNSFIKAGLWDEARVFTGQGSLVNGYAAPSLNNETPAFNTRFGTDELNVYVNKNSKYPYVTGLDL